MASVTSCEWIFEANPALSANDDLMIPKVDDVRGEKSTEHWTMSPKLLT